MARYYEEDRGPIYEAARQFRDKCLLQDGSLLFEGATVWSTGNLNRLRTVFVEAWDGTQRRFEQKLEDQVGKEKPEVIRLMAEAIAVYFLFHSKVGRPRKEELVNQVLGWAGDSIPQGHWLLTAFEYGIGNPGQNYNTRRPAELGFLIRFMIDWKKLPRPEQEKLLQEPWAFMKFVDGLEDIGNRQLRHILLHLLFPDQFERSTSLRDKWLIGEAFEKLAQPQDDADQKLQNDPALQLKDEPDWKLFLIRKALEKLLPGQRLDFYDSPLDATWISGLEGDEDEGASLDVIRHKKQLVLYGPPGTGKTFRAKEYAARIIRAAALEQLGPADYFSQQELIDAAMKTHVRRLQLHPAYSYEEFIRGLHLTPEGATEYRPGYLLRLINEIQRHRQKPTLTSRLPYVLILDEINRTDLSRMLGECFSLLEDREQPVELPGLDENDEPMQLRIPGDLYVIGTMNLIDQSVEQFDFALRRRFLWLPCPFDGEMLLSAAEHRWRERGGQNRLSWEKVEGDFKLLEAAASALNERIRQDPALGEQYEVGHTYFLDAVSFLLDELGPRPKKKKYFLWKDKEPTWPVRLLWKLSLKPLLEQYLSGLDASVRKQALEGLETTFTARPELSE
ncbi:AAA family ATPase [Hyalangium minutum]|uniref:AAA+ ATPase domain-containing protein n=1 Tax=Hyalangium minutum TaxID=394096 RepID=A0A085W7T2_9BACT|nr:AAA family ATPase [Hyalangium minutum]KFE63745.1 hypothetical protein DB31_2513 [Hyalangium minutum]